MTVALDTDPAMAKPWIDAAAPTHPSLIDEAHVTDELFGFQNVPMAVWIDESGNLVQPAHAASIEGGGLPPDFDISAFPPRIAGRFEQVMRIPRTHDRYRPALLDWVANGAASRHALRPDDVVARSQPLPIEHARAAACFELGHHLRATVGEAAAVPYWREAHALFPENWTYKRQAWTLVTTKPGEPADLIQEETGPYEGNWLDDVVAIGAENYALPPTTW